jgi:hypothetical protein
MPRTPKRIYGPALVATGPTTIYTVPANTKTVLRFRHLNNPSAGIVTFSQSIGADAAATRLYETYPIPAKGNGVTDSARPEYMNIPMEAGEILTVSAGTNNILTLTITADEYTLG